MEGILVFNSAAYGAILQKQLITPMEGTQNSTLTDGTVVCCDDEGRIRQAQYSSGAKVKRLYTYCLVQSSDSDSSYWYGDDNGRWYRLD